MWDKGTKLKVQRELPTLLCSFASRRAHSEKLQDGEVCSGTPERKVPRHHGWLTSGLKLGAKRRLDLLCDMDSHIVIVGVDENKDSDYYCTYEALAADGDFAGFEPPSSCDNPVQSRRIHLWQGGGGSVALDIQQIRCMHLEEMAG